MSIELSPIHALVFFLALVVVGEPLFVIISGLALLCFVGLYPGTQPLANKMTYVILNFAQLAEHDTLIAIPLFTLAGTIMTHGGISSRLVGVARALFGFLPGGLAMACVGACTLFAAISGSSAVTIIAIGGLVYPALRKEGFSDKFSLGLITSCGAIGILIPPSLPLIIYGVVASNAVADGRLKPSIDDLFRAGVIPSILSVAALCGYSALVAIWKKIPAEKFSMRELAVKLKEGFFALMLVVILLGGIYGGFTTATEASAVACVYALIVELFIHRAIGMRQLGKIMTETISLVGVILMVLVSALALTSYLTDQKVPDVATDYMRWTRLTVKHELVSDADYETVDAPVFADAPGADGTIAFHPFDVSKTAIVLAPDKIGARKPKETVVVGAVEQDEGASLLVAVKDPTDWEGATRLRIPKSAVVAQAEPLVHTRLGFLVAVNVLLLVVGSVMDIFSGIVVIAPLVVPMAVAYNVNLVHLGVIFVLNLELGLAHPPLGINLFITQSYFKKSILEVTIAAIPYLVLLLGVLAAVTYWEPLSLWFVHRTHG